MPVFVYIAYLPMATYIDNGLISPSGRQAKHVPSAQFTHFREYAIQHTIRQRQIVA
jgi:hypothetical protein